LFESHQKVDREEIRKMHSSKERYVLDVGHETVEEQDETA